MAWRLLLDAYVAAIGLIVGSYLNVLIYRLPRGISTVLPRSRCPNCNHRIGAFDNIPLLSFLLLRGRCRNCHAAISPRYPIVEATTAFLFVALVHTFGPTPQSLLGALFVSALIALALIDAEHYILPDLITGPSICVGLVVAPLLGWLPWYDAVLGVVVGGGSLWLLSLLWLLARNEEGLGLGDVKMLAMIGAFLGWQGVLLTLLLSSLAGSLVGVSLMLAGRMGRKGKLPFGVFLAVGALAALFFGPRLILLYTRLL